MKKTETNYKRKRGDRRDGRLLRDLDSMHMIMPILYPNRCDNEAFIQEIIDVSRLSEYLREYNEKTEGPKCSHFIVIIAAMLKTIMLRDKMNRFIVNGKTYQRFDVSASFVLKKRFHDDGEERLAFVYARKDDTLEDICQKVNAQISLLKSDDYIDSSSDAMDKIVKHVPSCILKFFINLMRRLDRHGKVPKSFVESDPYYASVVLTFLGSIKLQSGYHHLTNWGTNSVFLAVGEKKIRPLYDRKGNGDMKESIDIALTIDERIADGYYYSKTIRLFKKLVENPELLELPLSEEVKY